MSSSGTLSTTELMLVSAVALMDESGRILLAERPAGKHLAGHWEFPGGKVHEGETPEQALVRELKEELNITTLEECFTPLTFASHAYPDYHLLMPLYLCRVWSGMPEPQEGQRVAWVKLEDMADYPMPPADVPLVGAVRSFLKITSAGN